MAGFALLSSRQAGVALVACAALTMTRSGRAQDAPTGASSSAAPSTLPPAARSRVLITSHGPVTGVDALEPVLRELLERLPVALELRRAERFDVREALTPPIAPEPALARLFFDLSDPTAVVLYLVDSGWERVLVRRVATPEGLGEVQREELGHIAEASVEALLGGAELGVARKEYLAGSTPSPTAAAPRSRRPRTTRGPLWVKAYRPASSHALRLGVGYGLARYAEDLAAHGPTARVAWWAPGSSFRFGGALIAHWRVPNSTDTVPVDLRFEGQGARAVGSFSLGFARRLSLRVELGGGVDRERFQPSTDAARLRIAAPSTRVRGVARAALGLGARLFGSTELTLLGSFELDPTAPRYVYSVGDAREQVFVPALLRPGVVLEVSGALLGD